MYVAVYVGYVRGMSSAGTTTNGAETGEETAPEEGQRHEPERALACNPSTSGFTGKPALVLDRPGGIPQGYGLTSRRSVTEPRWVSSPPSYCATAPILAIASDSHVTEFASLPQRHESSTLRKLHSFTRRAEQGCRLLGCSVCVAVGRAAALARGWHLGSVGARRRQLIIVQFWLRSAFSASAVKRPKAQKKLHKL